MTAIGDSFRAIPFETLTVEKAAQIIDRETGLAELSQQVAILQRANDAQRARLEELLEAAKSVCRNNDNEMGSLEDWERLKQAIATKLSVKHE